MNYPQPLNLIGLEAFQIFLSKLSPVGESREIWIKLGHNQFYVGDFDTTGNFVIAQTKLLDSQNSLSRVKGVNKSCAYNYISQWCDRNNGGAFFIPSQPQGLPLKANVEVSDDIAAELDSQTAEEQWDTIWHFVEISGLKPSYIVHSGGKSYHPHWKLDKHQDINRITRLKKLLAIALHSDPAVVNPHQPMRLPGFYRKEKGAYQSLCFHHEDLCRLDQFESGLQRFYSHMGWIYPEVLSQQQWLECRRVINWSDKINQSTYDRLKEIGYSLPDVISTSSDSHPIITLTSPISEDIKNCEVKRILATEEHNLENNPSSRKPTCSNSSANSNCFQFYWGTTNPWVEFYQKELLPRIYSLDQAFDRYDHKFIRRSSNRLDGDPGYRASSGSKSFSVSWHNGEPWFRDWQYQESGNLIKYYWFCSGGIGYPKGKDYIEIVKKIADRLGIEIPENLINSKTSDRQQPSNFYVNYAYSNNNEPNEREYEEYLRQEQEFEKTWEAIANQEFITWLKAQINDLSKHFKGFVPKEIENTPTVLPEIIEYNRNNPLPTPGLYLDKQPPLIRFKKGDRLHLLMELKERGWKVVWDKSMMGSGKSHDAGLLVPDPDQNNKFWYLDDDHRNVSTLTVNHNYTDLPPRHDGIYLNEKGRLCVAKTFEQKSKAVVRSNCHLADLFVKFKEKGWDFESDSETKAPNAICANCKYQKQRAINSEGREEALCAASRGDGYGYRYERKEALSDRRIRASIHSLPNPKLDLNESSEDNNKSYNYSQDIAFLEEAGKTKGIRRINVTKQDLDLALIDLADKDKELFNRLHSMLVPIRALFNGTIPPEYAKSRFGFEHEVILDLLEEPPSDLNEIIDRLKEIELKGRDLIAKPEVNFNLKDIDPEWRGHAKFANSVSRAEAFKETLNNIKNIHANFLIPLLQIWIGNRGAIAFSRIGGVRQLIITVPDERITNILNSMGFLVLLDTTLNKKAISKVIDRSPNEIIEVQQKSLPLNNIKIKNIEVEGMGSSQWSRSCLDRALTLAEYLKSNHRDIAILGLKKYVDDLKFDGYWWLSNRGTNQFKGVNAIATFGTPQSNVGAAKAEYRTLFGDMDKFDDYYRSLVKVEFIQLVGRFRAHLYPNKEFLLYAVGTGLDLGYLTELGCQVERQNVVELCPEAATRRQADKWKLFNFCHQLQRAGERITQVAIAKGLNISQGWISQLFKGQSLTWTEFRKIFQSLYKSITETKIITPVDVKNEFLREFLDLDPLEMIEQTVKEIREYGVESFCELLNLAAPDVRMGILGILAASIGLNISFLS